MMKKGVWHILIVAAFLAPPATAFSAGKDGLPDGAKPMPINEARKLFAGKTWQWQAGGGYFGSDRTFKAVTGSGKSLMFAQGRWIVTDKSEVCFIANWHSRERTFKNSRTCFAHAINGQTVYQRKGATGPWYVFKHKSARAGDEYNKLKQGNTIEEAYSAAVEELR